jgi:hypothetical protein
MNLGFLIGNVNQLQIHSILNLNLMSIYKLVTMLHGLIIIVLIRQAILKHKLESKLIKNILINLRTMQKYDLQFGFLPIH